jgi:hypothetical protein
MGLLRRGEEVRVTSSQDTAGGHMALQIPFTTRSGQVVVHHAAGSGAGMKDPIVSDVDRDVIDLLSGAGKEEQITGLERRNVQG